MPLDRRCATSAVSNNISMMIKKDGKPQDQAIAIALSVLKKACGVDYKSTMTPKEIVAYAEKKKDEECAERCGSVAVSMSHPKKKDKKDKEDKKKKKSSKYESLMASITENKNIDRDGSVNRSEFDRVSHPPINKELDANGRRKLEKYILDKTPSAHKFLNATGYTTIVYFDDRGRAAASSIVDLSDDEIVRLAYEKIPKGQFR
jgi:hypothetical protein